jgi:hypothetical protein
MTTGTPLVSGEFNIGAFGPTLRLVILDLEGVAWLRSVFISMREARSPYVLTDRSEVSIPNISLVLQRAVSRPTQNLIRQAHGDRFIWVCTDEEWETNALMLDPFIAGRSGHQYLTSERRDDALVELSFGEVRAAPSPRSTGDAPPT